MITYKQRELWLIFDFKKKQWYEKKLRKKLKVNFFENVQTLCRTTTISSVFLFITS